MLGVCRARPLHRLAAIITLTLPVAAIAFASERDDHSSTADSPPPNARTSDQGKPRAATVGLVQPPRLPAVDFSQQNAHPVVDVLAGDVIVIELAGVPTKLQLAGVDTPSTQDPRGRLAEDYLKRVLVGERVFVDAKPFESDQDGVRDAKRVYTLPRAFVYRAPDGLFINLQLVRLGYGRALQSKSLRFGGVFAYYEAAAKRHEKGIWGAAPAPTAVETNSAAPLTEPTVGPAEHAAAVTPAGSTTVYVTRTGVCYHTADCKHAQASGKPTTLAEAKRKKLSPCSVCNPPK